MFYVENCVLRGYCRFFCVFNTFDCRGNNRFFRKRLFLCSVLIVQKSVIIDYRLNMTLFLLFSVTVIVLRSVNIAIELQKLNE